LVDTADMVTSILDILVGCLLIHGYDNLFARQALSCHIDARLGLILTSVNDFLNLIDFLILKFQEHFFDFEHVHSGIGALGVGRGLSI